MLISAPTLRNQTRNHHPDTPGKQKDAERNQSRAGVVEGSREIREPRLGPNGSLETPNVKTHAFALMPPLQMHPFPLNARRLHKKENNSSCTTTPFPLQLISPSCEVGTKSMRSRRKMSHQPGGPRCMVSCSIHFRSCSSSWSPSTDCWCHLTLMGPCCKPCG